MKVSKLIELKQSLRPSRSKYLSRLIAVCLLLISIVSCQSINKVNNQYSTAREGVFEGYTYIKDKVKNKSFIVNFKTLIKEYSNLRLDITAPLIGHLASATVNGSQVQYMIPRQRKFYSGDVSGLNLGNKLPFPMDLKLLFNIFWAKKFNDSNWVCTDESSLKFNCFQRAENLTVRWSLHKNRQPKEIILIHPKGVVQFKVKSFASGLTQEQKNRFVMKKPNW